MRGLNLANAFGLVAATATLALGQPAPAFSQDDQDDAHPDLLDTTLSPKGDLEDDDKPKRGFLRLPTALAPWFEFKEQLAKKHGLLIGGSYGVLWQNYSSSLIDEEDSVGHKFTFNLSYALANRGAPNTLWYEMAVEDRRPLGTELPPLFGGLAAGTIVPTAATWGEFDLGVTQSYLRQDLFNHRVQYAVGKVFAPNFINAFPFFDDNRQFLNQTFSTSPTIPAPLRGFGAVGAWYPTQGGLYVKGGIYTNHSDDTGFTADAFFTEPEHFYHVEAGWSALARSGTPVQARGPMDTNNFSVTLWKRDEQDFGAPIFHAGSEGIAFNANYLINGNFMVFARGGTSDGWIVDENVTAGFGWRPREEYSDLFGFGWGWAKPSNPFLREQNTWEVFYRFMLTENLALTPDIQYITDPALDPTEDELWVFSMRTRVTF